MMPTRLAIEHPHAPLVAAPAVSKSSSEHTHTTQPAPEHDTRALQIRLIVVVAVCRCQDELPQSILRAFVCLASASTAATTT